MREGHRHQGHGDIMGYSVRTKQHRYVEWREWTSRKVVAREVYDHAVDPDETQNVAGNDPVLTEKLSALLDAGWESARPDLTQTSPKHPMNVLFLAVDDMKDWVGCLNGYEGSVQTPNIDQLAKDAKALRADVAVTANPGRLQELREALQDSHVHAAAGPGRPGRSTATPP